MTPETASRPFGSFERMMASRYLRAKKAQGGVALISIISFVGILLAVGVLIITMSVMNGFRETMISRILGANGHVYVEVNDKPPEERARLIKLAKETPGVTHVSEMIQGQVLASANGQATGALVRGISARDLADMPIVANNIVGGSLKSFAIGEDGIVPARARLSPCRGAWRRAGQRYPR